MGSITLLAEDDSRLVAFIRNRGENVEIGGEPSSWVRKPTRTSFRLDVSLPGEYEGFLHAFDDETRETVRINGK